MQHLPDFPPLPDCFSHLVISSTDGDPRSFTSQLSLSESQSMASSLRFSGRLKGLTKMGSFDEFDSYIMNGTRSSLSRGSVHEDSDGEEPVSLTSVFNKANVQNAFPQLQQSVLNTADDVTDQKNPFLKLQTSLLKLQREMKDLRYLDISLFCQLLSLHEAVQEYKATIADRYSETGSEYSLGTASYMGSMSSLNDDSDWGEDGTLLISSHEQMDGSEIGDDSQSASSLLKQITELVLRADTDF